jgi:hypothetical protein
LLAFSFSLPKQSSPTCSPRPVENKFAYKHRSGGGGSGGGSVSSSLGRWGKRLNVDDAACWSRTVQLSPTVMVLLNLFSGHRRLGDIQWQIENKVWHGTAQVFVLSDIVISRDRGNLGSIPVIEYWASMIRSRRVHRLVRGPPM